MKAKIQTKKPVLIMMYGFPGAGKTHFARNVAQSLQCAHIHDDRIRHELFEQPRYDAEENDVVEQLMQYMTEEFMSAGMNVIYDANTSRTRKRKLLRDMARGHGAETLVVWFQMDADSAFARVRSRDRRKTDDKHARDYTEDMFRTYVGRMQQPKHEDYIVVSGKHVFASQSAALYKKLLEEGLVAPQKKLQDKVAKPGLVNLIPRTTDGRVDHGRRNISIY